MNFNFDEFLEMGGSAADAVVSNNREIQEVLDELSVSISRFLDLNIVLNELTEFEGTVLSAFLII